MSSTNAYEIQALSPPIVDKTRLQQCYDIRVAVFHHEQRFPLDTEFDEHDETDATHFLLLHPSTNPASSREPAGTARCYRASDGSYKLSRLAVLERYRGHGYGLALVRALHDFVRQDAGASAAGQAQANIVSHSQIPAKPFYARLGYVPEGDEFDEDGAPHQRMVLRLSN